MLELIGVLEKLVEKSRLTQKSMDALLVIGQSVRLKGAVVFIKLLSWQSCSMNNRSFFNSNEKSESPFEVSP